MTDAEHRLLAIWAVVCAEHVAAHVLGAAAYAIRALSAAAQSGLLAGV